MLRRFTPRLAPGAASRAASVSLTPLEILTQVQLGLSISTLTQKTFLLENCGREMTERGITEAKLLAMDSRLSLALLRSVIMDRYLSGVPFKVFSFDMEFTGPPVFTQEGPTEDITEIGVYSPDSDALFSTLVKPPFGRQQGPGVAELTGITDEMLHAEGLPFVQAWDMFLDFIHNHGDRPAATTTTTTNDRILLLSHGGKLADVSLIKWTLEKHNMKLPSSFIFGDTVHLIRDCHRRRPVTIDKHPPSWKLGDLINYLKVPPTLPAHRAGNDAKMTWDALYHTLLRYGDDELAPREQLVTRFFDEEAKRNMSNQQNNSRWHDEDDSHGGSHGYSSSSASSSTSYVEADMPRTIGSSSDAASALDIDFDDIFDDGPSQQAGGEQQQQAAAEAVVSMDHNNEGDVDDAEVNASPREDTNTNNINISESTTKGKQKRKGKTERSKGGKRPATQSVKESEEILSF